MSTPRIIINSPWCKQRVVTVNKPAIRIGRTPDNDIVFTHQCVSRSHAVIVRDGDNYVIEDIHSKHGTFINRLQITRQRLKSRDIIHLGLVRETEMLFQIEESTNTSPDLAWMESPGRTDRTEFNPRDLEMLLEISRVMNSTLVLQDVLNLVMDSVIQLTKAQHGFLMLIDEEGELQFTIARNLRKESLNQDEFKISRTIVTKVKETGEPLISGNILQEDGFKSQQSVLELQLKTVMCVPLKISTAAGQPLVIGVIYIHNKIITPTFSRKTLDLLEYLAAHAAIAIQNAKHHEETKIRERMQKELEIAYEIQTSLLPQSNPLREGLQIFTRSVPAAQVGGDFYNFIRFDDDRIGIAIGDVIGKSVPAALLMSATLSIHETVIALRNDLHPRDVIALTNHLVCQKTRGSRFVTFMYGILDLSRQEFTFSNAGHNYPILLRDHQCSEIVCNGPALGMFDEDNFEAMTIELKDDDMLLLYTDGLVESVNSKRELFGFERLTETISSIVADTAYSFGNELLETINSYGKGTPQLDDMTLLCLKLSDSPETLDQH